MSTRKEANLIVKEIESKRSIEFITNCAFKKDFVPMCIELHEMLPFFYDLHNIWWQWNANNYCWEMTDEVELLNRLRKILPPIIDITKSSNWGHIVKSLMLTGRERKPKDIEGTWIQFKGLIYDVKTDSTFKASPEYFITNPLQWDIGENEDTPVMDKLFEEWVGKDRVDTLYEILAYCCLPDYPIHRIFCFTGSGSNGKSKYLDLIVRFVGRKNCTSSDLDSIGKKSFEAAKLYKKLVCQMGETNFNVMSRTETIKKLTGQDLMSFELKNKNPFDAVNYAKILISSNQLPATTDKTRGFYRRWLIIDFPNEFDEVDGLLDRIPEIEYNNLAKKCITKLKLLFSKTGNEKFTNEGDVNKRIIDYEEKSNPMGNFLSTYTENHPDGYIFKFELRNLFGEFCKERRLRTWTDREISQYLKDLGYTEAHRENEWQMSEKRSTWSAWIGLKIKTNVGINASGVGINTIYKNNILAQLKGDASDGAQTSTYNPQMRRANGVPSAPYVPHEEQVSTETNIYELYNIYGFTKTDITHIHCIACNKDPVTFKDKLGRPICYDCVNANVIALMALKTMEESK